jgi:hypothetical protein
MCLNGRAFAAAALVCVAAAGGGGSTPGPVTQTAPATLPPGPVGTSGAGAPLRASAPQAAGSLGGRVVHAETRAPVSRARITLTSPALSEPRATISAPDGAYEFRNLPAGAYTLAARRTGFAAYRHGERRGGPPVPLALADGQSVGGIELALVPAGVIVGQVLDEDGAPFAGAAVDALVSRLENGQATLVSVATADTDDRGGFRLTALPAGQYYVSAFDPAFANVGDATGPLRYTATYYPGVPFLEDATRVPVTPGTEPAASLVFKLRIIRPARVSGRLATLDRRQLITGAVLMRPLRGSGLAAVPTQDVVILPDGTFSFRNVPPGRYQIRARGEVDPQGISRFATFSIAVEGQDIQNVDLVLRPGADVEGTIVAEPVLGPKPPALTGLRVRAPSADGSSFGDPVTGDVAGDGSYRIRGLMAGLHYITLDGLEPPWVLKRVTHRGQDITDEGIQVDSSQELQDVRVTITDVATEVAGIVRDSADEPVADALVLVIPGAPQFRTPTSRRFGVLRSDAGGRYAIRGLPAGEYRIVATLEIDESELHRVELLQQLSDVGVPVSLAERQLRTVDLTLTTSAATALRHTTTR